MFIDMNEIERIGGLEKNPDIRGALKLLKLSGVLTPCDQGDHCVCGGDTERVRQGCAHYVHI